ncbi:MAG: glucose 1-dehydrogenase [Actinobacteria bacterium]|nr:glucose 1-dehydrogenase [Actinomycetota bacterium]
MERVALVTGAETGLGRAIAARLQEDGLGLVFATRTRDEDAAAAFEEASARGSAAHWVSGDLSDPDVPELLVSEGLEALGRLDVLVSNAGITLAKPALELTHEDFDRIFSVDVRAAFLLARAAAPRMREAGGGSIVTITSVHEHVPRPGFALYAAAKAALGMLTRGLALELAADGIRVNAVAPGFIVTERNRADAEKASSQIPLGRPGEPEEVAALVSYLASDEAGYVTGSSFLIDGGLAQNVLPPAF